MVQANLIPFHAQKLTATVVGEDPQLSAFLEEVVV